MSKPQYKKRGAPKGTVTNPQGNNQYDGILSDKNIQSRLLKEDDERLREIAKDKPKGWMSEFIRNAVSKAIKNYQDE